MKDSGVRFYKHSTAHTDCIEVARMPDQKESKLLRFAYYALPILLVVYVLSIGPAYAFVVDSKGSPEYPVYVIQAEIFYAPVIIVASSHPRLTSLLLEYIHFWKIKILF